MYKTVRHGENSLQYTILPQTEEVLTNSGLKGKGRDYSPSVHVRRAKRKSTIKYVALVIFGIVVALVLAAVPLYVMHGNFFTRKGLQANYDNTITSAPHIPTGRDLGIPRKKILKTPSEPVVAPMPVATTPSTTTTSASTTQTAAIDISTLPPWSMPALRSWRTKSSTAQPEMPMLGSHDDIPLITPSANEPSTQLLGKIFSTQSWGKEEPTGPTQSSTTENDVVRYHEGIHIRPKTPKSNMITKELKFENDFVTTKLASTIKATQQTAPTERSKMQEMKDMLFSDDDDVEFKNSLEIDDVFTLPPLGPDYPAVSTDEVTVSKTTNGGWYSARWPFVDTSSYFQWTSYSPSDNLLLPLLVSALSSIALVLLLVFAVRRRKRSYMNATNNVNASTDTHEDDNTNLLTAENPEDPEEE